MNPNRRTFVKLTAGAGAGLFGLAGTASAAGSSAVDDAPVVESATYPTLGTDASNPTATVYGNFKCPYTRKFVLGNLGDLVSDYVEPGRLNVRFRTVAYEPFPSDPSHGSADWYISSSDPRISEAGLGVWDVSPDDYWAYCHDMFQNQVSGNVSLDELTSRMADSGVDSRSTIRRRVAADRYAAEVRRSKEAARDVNLQWTPWMAFRGDTTSPHHSYSGLSRWLDARVPAASAESTATEGSARTLRVDGRSAAGDASYEFSVSGEVRPLGDAVEGHDDVGGDTVGGRVYGLDDRYEITGEITGITIRGSADLYIDGAKTNPNAFPSA